MVNAMDQTFTDAEFKQNIRKFVGVETGDANTLSLDKQDLKILVGEIKRYYLCEDIVYVNLRDKKSTWKCYISHIVHHDANINYIPQGVHKIDENGLDYLVPDNKIMGLVCAINGDYNSYGAILLGYLGFDDSDYPLNPRENTFKIQVGSKDNNYRLKISSNGLDIKNEKGTVISVNDYNLSLKTEKLLINDKEYNFKSIVKDLNYCKDSILRLNKKLEGKSENIKNIIDDLNYCKNSILNVYTKSEIDSKILESGSFDSTLYYTKTEIDEDIINEINKIKKVAYIQLRTPLVVHNGVFEVYITDYAGNPITGATVKDKVEWGSSSTSNVTLIDKGGGVYQKSAFLSTFSNIRVKNTITFTHSNYNSRTVYFQIYLT
ncbi:MAG: hypothetical protein MR750_08865 [Methanobrevibacter boviskoreani]|uniref:hypothetical protein n=1 Tax=Methanobrevibacter boviskoreani TaxID=1348249 RepID=UPI0023A8AE46|nr:hypothetical protein [Methanobrevibacter boviskoreani]MCI6931346.1 hypothetical protein [Methanobrevibacter boviskoreani]